MPNNDRTGPQGMGAMTGRGLGLCGNGRGRGFGFRARTMPVQQLTVITEKQEKEFLEQELIALKEEMKDIEERLKK